MSTSEKRTENLEMTFGREDDAAEARFNILGFFSVLEKIDQRINSQINRYDHENKDNKSVQN